MPRRPSPERGAERWRLVSEAVCDDGDNDEAIRAFHSDHPALTAFSKRLKIEVVCDRSSGRSVVRFYWNDADVEPTTRRKPRHGATPG